MSNLQSMLYSVLKIDGPGLGVLFEFQTKAEQDFFLTNVPGTHIPDAAELEAIRQKEKSDDELVEEMRKESADMRAEKDGSDPTTTV